MDIENKLIEIAKEKVKVLTIKIDDLVSLRKDLLNDIKNECKHSDIKDLTETYGRDCDDGYGHWWKNPYFKCNICGSIDESYSHRVLTEERVKRQKLDK